MFQPTRFAVVLLNLEPCCAARKLHGRVEELPACQILHQLDEESRGSKRKRWIRIQPGDVAPATLPMFFIDTALTLLQLPLEVRRICFRMAHQSASAWSLIEVVQMLSNVRALLLDFRWRPRTGL